MLCATTAKLHRARYSFGVVQRKLRVAQADAKEQARVLKRFAAAGSGLDDAAGSTPPRSSSPPTAPASCDSLTKLTNAVAALGVYLEQTSVSELDPAYLDAQVSYLKQALGSLQSRSERIKSGAGSVAAARQELARDVASLQRLTEPGR